MKRGRSVGTAVHQMLELAPVATAVSFHSRSYASPTVELFAIAHMAEYAAGLR